MRLSYITDEATQSFRKAVELAHLAGLEGLELRSADDCPVDLIPRETLRAWRTVLDGEGLSVPSVAGSFYKCPIHGRDRELDKLRRLCDAAEILGAPIIRGFTLFPPGDTCLPAGALAKYFDAPAAILRERGLKMALEPDPGVNTTNHRALAALLRELDPDIFGAVCDPGNDVFDPLGEPPFPTALAAVLPRLLHVHVKDAVREGVHIRCVAPGTGSVDWPQLISALRACGYGGWLSLEPHYRAGTELTEEQMRLPSGSAFSAGGAAALLESAAAIRKIMESGGDTP